MCNCYGHKCECCDDRIPMHIGDFKFPPEDFRCWCPKHFDQAPPGAVVFTLLEDAREFNCRTQEFDGALIYAAGTSIAIIGPEVGGEGHNHPNLAFDMSERVVQGGA